MEQRTFGWRELLGTVNLNDFSQMVASELGMIGASVRLALESLPGLPLGPLIFLGGILMAFLRFVLLVLVVAVFGAAILTVTVVRSAVGIARRQTGRGEP